MIATGVALSTGLIVMYLVLLWLIRMETDEKLMNSVMEIETKIESGGTLPQMMPFIETSETLSMKETNILKDTSLFDARENEAEPYRELTSVRRVKGRFYRITVRSSKIENGDFLTSAFIILAIVYSAFILGVFVFTRKRIARLWAPFFKNLSLTRAFSLSGFQPVQLEKTGIDEFDEMKEVVEQFTNRALDDYQNLKQFTGNASHEMQTPLAAIKGKLESMLNDERLTPELASMVRSVDHSVSRLGRLNRSLLLLARIESRQYPEKTEVSFRSVVLDLVDQFSELAALKNISIVLLPGADFQYIINADLASVLVSNLLLNAVNHNYERGFIEIQTSGNTMKFSNSGTGELVKKEKVFQRFVKENDASDSPGLGLSIVSTICNQNKLELSYSWDEVKKQHVFTVKTIA